MRTRRLELGYTQVELAAIVGCSQGNVTNLETGRNKPSLQLAIAIAKALRSSVADLFDETTDDDVTTYEPTS